MINFLTNKQKRFILNTVFASLLTIIVLAILSFFQVFHPDTFFGGWLQRHYSNVPAVTPDDLVGTWKINNPYYDAAYGTQISDSLVGWEKSVLVLNSDGTFYFKPILFYELYLLDMDIQQYVSTLQEKRFECHFEIIEQANSILKQQNDYPVMQGKWGLVTYKEESGFTNDYRYYYHTDLRLIPNNNPEKAFTVGTVIATGQKELLHRYCLKRFMNLREYGGVNGFFYQHISLDTSDIR